MLEQLHPSQGRVVLASIPQQHQSSLQHGDGVLEERVPSWAFSMQDVSGPTASNHIWCDLKATLSCFTAYLERIVSTTGESSGHLTHLESGMLNLATFACLALYFILELKTVSKKALPSSESS